ncbi:hypothetical protein K435DRAFT_692245, partial [Dendrothele bispora CBS 962.96]
MGPGSHHDTLDDHMGHWNWCKIVGLGGLLKKRLMRATSEYQRLFDPWKDFTQKQIRDARNWKKTVDDYELGLATYNPFESPLSGKTAQAVRLELAKEAQEKARQEMLDTSPGEFLFFGLEIEQQQRELLEDISTIRDPTNKQLTQIVDRRTKLMRQIRRFRALQLGYMPISLQIIATLPSSQSQLNAEEIPLYLPSQLSSSQRSSNLYKSELTEMEGRLRDGLLNESLNDLRQSLLVKQRLLRYKKINARNQGATTRSRRKVGRQDRKVKLAAATYRAAWKAKLSLLDGNQEALGWNKLLDEHIVGMEDLQEAEQRRAKAAKTKRADAARRALVGENPVPGAREKNRVPSWIWHGTTQGELQADRVLYDGLRIEWCKTYA